MEGEMIQKKVKGTARALRILAQISFWVSIAAEGVAVVITVLMQLFPDTFAQWLGSTGNGSLNIDAGMLKYDAIAGLTGVQMLSIDKAFLSMIAISCLMAVFLLRQLIGMLREVEEGRPFSQTNAKRLAKMGILLFISSVLYPIGQGVMMNTMINAAGCYDLGVKFSPDTSMIFIGILLFILAGIFRYGSYLQDEYDATL